MIPTARLATEENKTENAFQIMSKSNALLFKGNCFV